METKFIITKEQPEQLPIEQPTVKQPRVKKEHIKSIFDFKEEDMLKMKQNSIFHTMIKQKRFEKNKPSFDDFYKIYQSKNEKYAASKVKKSQISQNQCESQLAIQASV